MNWVIGKDLDTEKDWGQEEKGTTEDEMVGWQHWLNGHEFEQAVGVGEWQGGLACYGPWGRRVKHNWVNWTKTSFSEMLYFRNMSKTLMFLTRRNYLLCQGKRRLWLQQLLNE